MTLHDQINKQAATIVELKTSNERMRLRIIELLEQAQKFRHDIKSYEKVLQDMGL